MEQFLPPETIQGNDKNIWRRWLGLCAEKNKNETKKENRFHLTGFTKQRRGCEQKMNGSLTFHYLKNS